MLRVMVVENSDVLRTLWRHQLGSIPGVLIISETDCADHAIEALRSDAPDVVLLDIELTRGKGMEVLKAAVAESPGVKVIMVTNYGDPIYRNHYLHEGAYAFYDKSYEIRKLRTVLEQLAFESLINNETRSVQHVFR